MKSAIVLALVSGNALAAPGGVWSSAKDGDRSAPREIPDSLKQHIKSLPFTQESFVIHDSFTLPYGQMPNGPAFFYPLNYVPEDSPGTNAVFGNMRHGYKFNKAGTLNIFECDIPKPGSKRHEQLRDLFHVAYQSNHLTKDELAHNKRVIEELDKRFSEWSYNVAMQYLKPNYDIKTLYSDHKFQQLYMNEKAKLYQELGVPPTEWSLHMTWPQEDLLSRFMKALILNRMGLGDFANGGSDFTRVACEAIPGIDGFANCMYPEMVLCRPDELLVPDASLDLDESDKAEIERIRPYTQKLFAMLAEKKLISNPEAFKASF